MYAATNTELSPREPQGPAASGVSENPDQPSDSNPDKSQDPKPTPGPNKDPTDGLGPGAVAGIIIGVAISVGVIAFGLFRWSKGRKGPDIVEPHPYEYELHGAGPYIVNQPTAEIDAVRAGQGLPGGPR